MVGVGVEDWGVGIGVQKGGLGSKPLSCCELSTLHPLPNRKAVWSAPHTRSRSCWYGRGRPRRRGVWWWPAVVGKVGGGGKTCFGFRLYAWASIWRTVHVQHKHQPAELTTAASAHCAIPNPR